ncbi:hypothetical protein FAZ95_24350 [Trinickia violacea]|uniref:Uncharacterized protein n=1 Tax=Trinickia violacea TaxID=2571746 RepID=A0A4P8IWP0_9BURK|nr:hypothetical protein [Trinickia violacea]QCP52315.1 hypothetical protein FAZ95_24350 [Trinickia violacea]
MNDPAYALHASKTRFLSRVASAAALTALVCAVIPASSYAQVSTTLVNICKARANTAKLVAQDRDAGVSKEDELRKSREIAAAMPVGRQEYALAEMAAFIDKLYGKYASMPPQDVYTKYLAYCEAQASGQKPPY